MLLQTRTVATSLPPPQAFLCGRENLGGKFAGGAINAGKGLLNNVRFSGLSVDSRVCRENLAENDPL